MLYLSPDTALSLAQLLPAFAWLVCLSGVVWWLGRSRDEPRWLYLGFASRMAAGLLLGVLYLYYYTEGDVTSYYNWGRYLSGLMIDDPLLALRVYVPSFFSKASGLSSGGQAVEQLDAAGHAASGFRSFFWENEAAFFTARYVGLLSLLGFQSFWAMAILNAGVSVGAAWLLYRSLRGCCPPRLLWGLLFLYPSLVLWTSGHHKDTLTLLGFAGTVYAARQLLGARQPLLGWLRSLAVLGLSLWLVYAVRFSMAAALAGCLPLWAVWRYSRPLAVPYRVGVRAATVLLGLLVLLLVRFNGMDLATFSHVLYKALREEKAKPVAAGEPVGYLAPLELPGFEPDFLSALRQVPRVFVYVFFEPLRFGHSALITISSLEGVAYWCLVAWLLVRGVRWGWPGWRQPILVFCFVFALGFGLFVGLSVPVVGSMVRYRIYAMLCLAVGMAILSSYSGRDPNRSVQDSDRSRNGSF
ncbi:MAG: hypothetical protein LW884_08795 [Bacteroidetes bacterium]|jgi:hypothetical protein|nr:hypothetical protein [Bacteroidota bacterium]